VQDYYSYGVLLASGIEVVFPSMCCLRQLASWHWWAACRPVFTIHNMNYGADLIGKAMQAAAVATTVSPTYAVEISGHAAVSPHLGKMYGVRNGIDMDIWDPSCDPFLPVKYSIANIDEGKARLLSSLHVSFTACLLVCNEIGCFFFHTQENGIWNVHVLQTKSSTSSAPFKNV
jgi:starch synthase